MKTEQNTWFGASTYVSMTVMLALIVWGFVLPSTSDETPGWVWALTLLVIVAVVVFLVIGRIYRRIAFGIVIACVSPLAVLLALGVAVGVGKVVGGIFG